MMDCRLHYLKTTHNLSEYVLPLHTGLSRREYCELGTTFTLWSLKIQHRPSCRGSCVLLRIPHTFQQGPSSTATTKPFTPSTFVEAFKQVGAGIGRSPLTRAQEQELSGQGRVWRGGYRHAPWKTRPTRGWRTPWHRSNRSGRPDPRATRYKDDLPTHRQTDKQG